MVYAPAQEEQRPAVQEPLPAPEPEKKSSPPAARDTGKLTAPASPRVALPASLPPPPATEQGGREAAPPQPAADSATSRPAAPEAVTSSRGQAPPAALLSPEQGGAERPGLGASRVPMPAAAPLQTKAATREKAMPPAAGERLETSIPGLLNDGERALESARYGEAAQAFSQALKLLPPGNPDRPRALLGLARAQEGQKDRSGALQTYRELAQESSAHRDLAERKLQELSAEIK